MSMRNPNGFIRPGYDPLQVADAPTAVTPTPDNTVASVDFTPPSNVGGAAVSEYYAVVQPGNITATSVTPPVAVTGLTNGVEYTTKVWANNAYGPSPYSPQSSGFIPQLFTYVEDVFSTYLYTGNGSTQTITNGIDLDGEGGMVWLKSRSLAEANIVVDSARGPTFRIGTNSTVAQADNSAMVSAFTSNGFSLGDSNVTNTNASTNVSWTFRKAPKFFDVVTYTGDSSSNRQISHSLGSVPGCIIIKQTSASGENWVVYHRSNGATGALYLNDTRDILTADSFFNDTEPTSTNFTVSNTFGVNRTDYTYVAYLFAHDAGGFGDDGLQNVISCGSYTGNGSATGPVVTLGYEPQWVLYKSASAAENWYVVDNMRGVATGGATQLLLPNLSNAEITSASGTLDFQANGFQLRNGFGGNNENGVTYIYIAIRRPMKTPESGTEVFAADGLAGATAPNPWFTSGFPVDMSFTVGPSNPAGFGGWFWSNRFTPGVRLDSSSTAAETSQSNIQYDYMTGAWDPNGSDGYFTWMFRRAPGFFEQVCYTGTGVAKTVAHGLGAVPELMIVKERNNTGGWQTYSAATGNTKYLYINSTAAAAVASAVWNDTSPTASVFTVGTGGEVNEAGSTYIAHLFATVAGVSKVGSYVGNGTTQTIDCGFSAGARFVMVKRSSNSGSWLVFDSARGIVSGNDPYLQLNNTDAEVTNTDRVDPAASGFTVNFIAGSDVDTNVNNDTYIFLAIA